VAAEALERDKRERLCRDIGRPAVACGSLFLHCSGFAVYGKFT
jgi:hypothetical protein